jgi:glycosyltransferase involved in cell wall biosynthesis
MRILLLHSSSDLYGASRIFLQTVTILRKHGHDCVVVLSNKGSLEQALEAVGAEVYIVNLGILRRKYFTFAGLFNRIQKWRNASTILNSLIRAHQIELVYSNTAAVLIGAWVARTNRLRHIWHLHEIIEQPKLLHQFLGWQIRRGADTLIVVSDAVAKCWESHLSVKTNLIRIYNGIEPIIQPVTIDYRKQFNLSDDAIVLGLAGRIHVIKGQPYFLEIAKALKKTNNFSNLHFFIAGDPYPGQEYLLDQMFALIRAYQLEASVHYLGQVDEMSNFYAAINLLVVSSIQPDSLPTVILEAMQYGIPVVATAQGGALEMVKENETGIFIPLDNAAVAAEKINAILPASTCQQMGAAGKERVATYFSQAAFEKNMLGVFEKNHATLKLAIIGSRGYPYVYSGYETLVKALAERLPAKGVEITVYCHAHLFPKKPAMVNGIRLVYIPTLPFKSLAQPIHSFFAFWHMVFTNVDVALVLNVSNGPFGIIARLFGKSTMMNVDGLEWLRPKWKGFGGVYFKWAAKMATRFMDLLITDADAMQAIYLKEFGAKSVVITYGAETSAGAELSYLSYWNLVERDYYLIVGRMIPDNNADILIEGFIQSNSTKKLVIVGDVPYQDAYADKIRSYQDPRLVFTGYVRSPETLASLYKYCYAYLHGHEFGGTNPTLLKAMANGCAIAALDTIFSREVLQNEQFGFYFSKSSTDCTRWFNWAESHVIDIEAKRAIIHQGITEKYTWETVSDLYLYHLKSLANIK